MKFRPLHDWVLIKRSKAAEMTVSGIIIPESAKDKPAKGVVEAVGPGRYKEEKGKKDEQGKKVKKFVPTVLKPGEEVMFVDYMAKDVELDDREITLVREEDVLGIVEQGGALAVKEPYQVEVKKERPPMVQAKPERAAAKEKAGKAVKPRAKAAAAPAAKKPSKPKNEKASAKKPQKKATTTKKTAIKKTAVKKTAAKKAPAKKTSPKKGPVKKTTAKKSAAKKSATMKPAAKKTAAKKPAKAVSKKTSPKKPVKKAKR